MSGFAALMALSASQTKEAQSAVQSALAQRQRKEELRRKQQEERDRKERELETKLRLQHFEEEKREQERQRRLEQERQARERALQRREEEQRDALRYGPKRAKAVSASDGAPRWPTASTHSQETRKRKFLSDEDDDSAGGSPGASLTREEKRERKLQAELKRTFHTAKRSTHTGGYVREGRRLPGGAIDVTTTSPGQADITSAAQSIKARISAIPNTLTKLNIVKRDVRTIDEIRQDLAKVKVLAGDEAREFNDWFGKAKRKEPVKGVVQPSASAPPSGANTPASQTSSKGSPTAPGAVSGVKKTIARTSSPSGSKLSATSLGIKHSLKSTRHNSHTPPTPKHGSTQFASTAKTTFSNSSSLARSSTSAAKKHIRTPTLTDISPPKKRAPSPSQDLSNEIWKLFGKDRGSYVRRDVLSDDEDMEVDARLLEKEEMRSTRLARKEEEEAMEAERHHEHEKRKRKKEREMRDRRG